MQATLICVAAAVAVAVAQPSFMGSGTGSGSPTMCGNRDQPIMQCTETLTGCYGIRNMNTCEITEGCVYIAASRSCVNQSDILPEDISTTDIFAPTDAVTGCDSYQSQQICRAASAENCVWEEGIDGPDGPDGGLDTAYCRGPACQDFQSSQACPNTLPNGESCEWVDASCQFELDEPGLGSGSGSGLGGDPDDGEQDPCAGAMELQCTTINGTTCVWEQASGSGIAAINASCRAQQCLDISDEEACNSLSDCAFDEVTSECIDLSICIDGSVGSGTGSGLDDGPGIGGGIGGGIGDTDACSRAQNESSCSSAGSECSWEAMDFGLGSGSGSGSVTPPGGGGGPPGGGGDLESDVCDRVNMPSGFCVNSTVVDPGSGLPQPPGSGSGSGTSGGSGNEGFSGYNPCPMFFRSADCINNDVCTWIYYGASMSGLGSGSESGSGSGSGSASSSGTYDGMLEAGECIKVNCFDFMDNETACNAHGDNACWVGPDGFCQENRITFLPDRSPCFQIGDKQLCQSTDECSWDEVSSRGHCRGPCSTQFAIGSCSPGCMAEVGPDGFVSEDDRCVAPSDASCNSFDEAGCQSQGSRCEYTETQYSCPFSQCSRGTPCDSNHICNTNDQGWRHPACCASLRFYCLNSNDQACFDAQCEIAERFNCSILGEDVFGSGLDGGQGDSGSGAGGNLENASPCYASSNLYDENSCVSNLNCTWRTLDLGSGVQEGTGFCDEKYCDDWSGYNQVFCQSRGCGYNTSNGHCYEIFTQGSGADLGSGGGSGTPGQPGQPGSGDDRCGGLGQAECSAAGCIYYPAEDEFAEDYCSPRTCYAYSESGRQACESAEGLDCTFTEFDGISICRDGNDVLSGGSGSGNNPGDVDDRGCRFDMNEQECRAVGNCTFIDGSSFVGSGIGSGGQMQSYCMFTACPIFLDESTCTSNALNCTWADFYCTETGGNVGGSGSGQGSGPVDGNQGCSRLSFADENTCVSESGCVWISIEGDDSMAESGFCSEPRCEFYKNDTSCNSATENCKWNEYFTGSGSGLGSGVVEGYCTTLAFGSGGPSGSGDTGFAETCADVMDEGECDSKANCTWTVDSNGFAYCIEPSCITQESESDCAAFNGNCTWTTSVYNPEGLCLDSLGEQFGSGVSNVNLTVYNIRCDGFVDRDLCNSQSFCTYVDGGPGCKDVVNIETCDVAPVECYEYQFAESCTQHSDCVWSIDGYCSERVVPVLPNTEAFCDFPSLFMSTHTFWPSQFYGSFGAMSCGRLHSIGTEYQSVSVVAAALRSGGCCQIPVPPTRRPTKSPSLPPSTPAPTPAPSAHPTVEGGSTLNITIMTPFNQGLDDLSEDVKILIKLKVKEGLVSETELTNSDILRVTLHDGSVIARVHFSKDTTDEAVNSAADVLNTSPLVFTVNNRIYRTQGGSVIADTEPSARPTAAPTSTAPSPYPTQAIVPSQPTTPRPTPSPPTTIVSDSSGSESDDDVQNNTMIVIIVCVTLAAALLAFAIYIIKGRKDNSEGRRGPSTYQNPIYAKSPPGVAAPDNGAGGNDKSAPGAKGLVRVESMC